MRFLCIVIIAAVLIACLAPAGAQTMAPKGGMDRAFKIPSLSEQVHAAWEFAEGQLAVTVGGTLLLEYPSYTQAYASWVNKDAHFWTSGFFPGCLWLLFERTGNPAHRTWAENWTAGLEGEKFNTTTHDIGFMLFNSFGNGYRLTQDPLYLDVLLQAAESLATRYDPVVGCIRSWDWGSWQFPVIVDNMMNLELLLWASKNGGQSAWRDMAISHAEKTLENHVRPDGSTCHVVDYDPATGGVIAMSTWQGYSADSTWARGQAWAIHGFTMVYRETLDPAFLDAARRIADFYIENLPDDLIPYWDFDAPGIPNTARDTSAAAIAASGLIELCALEVDPWRKKWYLRMGKRTLRALCTLATQGGYLGEDGQGNPLTPGLLLEGCYNHPDSFSHGSVFDESLIWGDYYFLEALLRITSL
ncbi:MAG: glycoside hydrolase family 88 protein [Planctomycetota bacterium]